MKSTTPTLSFNPSDKEGVVANLERLLIHRLAIQGNSGSGKSWLLRTLIEGTHGHVQHLIVDPEGEFRTLREVFDDYIILAASDGDLIITPESAENTARLLIEEGVNIILDLSEFGETERDAICAAVVHGLMSLSREAWRYILVVVDEAQTLAPQAVNGVSLDALTDLAMRGRKRGFGLVVATQRLALLNKNLLAMCSNRLIGLTTLGNDMKRASEELGFNTQERQKLKALEPGEFFAFGPALSQEVTKVRSGPTKSTHPAPGQLTPPTPPASKKLGSLLEQLRLNQQRVPSNIEEVENEIQISPRSRIPQKVEKREIEKAVKFGSSSVKSTLEQIRILADNVIVESAQLVPTHTLQNSLSDGIDFNKSERNLPTPRYQNKHTVDKTSSRATLVISKRVPDDPKHRILRILAEMELLEVPSLDRSTLAVLSEQSPKSSAFSRHVAALHNKGFVTYPSGGHVALTEQGRTSIPVPQKPTTLADLHERWFIYLCLYERQLLEELIEVHPSSLSRRGLAKRVNRSEGSSAFSRALANLKRLKLITYPVDKHVRASELIFPDWPNHYTLD